MYIYVCIISGDLINVESIVSLIVLYFVYLSSMYVYTI